MFSAESLARPYAEIQVEIGNDVSLKCDLCVIPGFSITWQKVKGRIAANRTEQTDCLLIIKNVTRNDTGNYSCVAKSKSIYSVSVLRQDTVLVVKGTQMPFTVHKF